VLWIAEHIAVGIWIVLRSKSASTAEPVMTEGTLVLMLPKAPVVNACPQAPRNAGGRGVIDAGSEAAGRARAISQLAERAERLIEGHTLTLRRATRAEPPQSASRWKLRTVPLYTAAPPTRSGTIAASVVNPAATAIRPWGAPAI
jgi:hypothetical protein